MQLVSDLQQRPKKGRLKIEKNIVLFYDLSSLVQLTVFLIHTVATMIGANRTFANYIIVNNDFNLTPSITYKTTGCSYNTIRDIYAFQSVNMTFTPESINDVFVDHAVQMRLAIFVCVATFFIGGVNRSLVEMNVFVIKFRNFYIWKDLLSAMELLMLAYVTQIASAVGPPRTLLMDYLRYCGVEGNAYLPFISVINLWVFVAVGYFTYVVGLFLYLLNTLPKYGIMTPAEIQEYREWLRARRAEQEQSRMLIEEARKAHARIQLMNNAEFHQGNEPVGQPPMMVPYYPMPGAEGGYPMQPGYTMPPGYPYPYPYYPGYGPPDAHVDPNLPPPQMFGAGMMPMNGNQPMGMALGPQGYGGMQGASPPPGMMSYMTPGTGSQPPINMPRRRNVPVPEPGQSPAYL